MERADDIIDVGRSSLAVTGKKCHHAVWIIFDVLSQGEENHTWASIPRITPPCTGEKEKSSVVCTHVTRLTHSVWSMRC